MKKLLLILLLPIIVFGQKETIIHINTDGYPNETRWVLHADSLYGTILGQINYGYYTQANTSYTDTLYIPDSLTNITFVIYDSYGDGIQSPGSYFVSICSDTIINYANPSFTTGLISNRIIPPCNGPPGPVGPCVPATLNINLDQFQSETSWEIHDSSGTLLYAGGPYSTVPDYQPQFEFVCLPVGEISLTMYDSYGDGLAGSLWGGNDGSYYLMQCGDTLVYGDVANYGTDTTHIFQSDTCIPPSLVPGCMDPNYVEYNPLATQDDSSCSILKIYGCTDSTMFNYDSIANTMDYIDSCDYTLILHDLVGNGWIGSRLEIYQTDTNIFYMSGSGMNQYFTIQLNAPKEVSAKFFVNAQASNTALECGFTLINPIGDTVISIVPPFIMPFFTYTGITYCGNECIEVVEGCMDSLAFNYDSLSNTPEPCYYYPGCISPAYVEWYQDTANGYYTDFHIQDSCKTFVVFGCMDPTMYNYDSLANIEPSGICFPYVYGCTNFLAFNYNPVANTDDSSCVPVIYGCINPLAFNYDSLANTDDGSCEPISYGCTDSIMWNYSPSANVDDGSCVPYIYGCMDPTMFNYNALANTSNNSCISFIYGCMDSIMFNYDPLANTSNNNCIPFIYGCTNPIALNYNPLANTDDFSCTLPIYGCTDSTMFNYNPLANVDNNSCIPYVYGCTDPSMLNFNPQANTEDFSCIAYIYGCTDSTALNYDSTANTDNSSCIAIVEGCMDPTAYNYSGLANYSDSTSCLYSSNCITGPGQPYWLNDPCYAWVIQVDDYCCENEWDDICQLTYNHCLDGWPEDVNLKIRENNIVIFPNPTKGIINFSKPVDIKVYNVNGNLIISDVYKSLIDLSKYSDGLYNIILIFEDRIFDYKIIKQ